MYHPALRSVLWVILCVLLMSPAAEASNHTIATAWQAVLAVYPFAHPGGEPYPKRGSSVTFEALAGYGPAYFVRVANATSATQTVSIVILETTLASPWYFVAPTSGYDSFVEIRNQSWGQITVTIYANPTGSGSIPLTVGTIVLAANSTQAVSLRSSGVTSGAGSLSITHDGMPGSIVANTTTLSQVTGLAFDALFAPRMVWSVF